MGLTNSRVCKLRNSSNPMFGARQHSTGIRTRLSRDAQHQAESRSNIGGADRDRTGGLLVANQALSQLSYSPTAVSSFAFPVPRILETQNPKARNLILVGLGRLELPTSPLSGVRSSHLSYRPGHCNIPEPYFDSRLLAASFQPNRIAVQPGARS